MTPKPYQNPFNRIKYIFFFIIIICSFVVSVYYDKLLVLTTFLGLIGAGIAIIDYTQSVKIKRLEWLLELFRRYMDEKKFRRIRYVIVFRVEPEYSLLRKLMESRSERNVDQPVANFEESLIMDMDDYLNFFELIATLWLKGELKRDEITMLYHDYIKYLWQIDFTYNYITNWGFESLSALSTELFGEERLPDNSKPTTIAK